MLQNDYKKERILSDLMWDKYFCNELKLSFVGNFDTLEIHHQISNNVHTTSSSHSPKTPFQCPEYPKMLS